jgi:transcription termination factor Rho
MAVLERSELQASSLADLHAIADQLGIDGFRRLRKADLIERILGGDGPAEDVADESPEVSSEDSEKADSDRPEGGRAKRRPRRGSSAARSRRSTASSRDNGDAEKDEPEEKAEPAEKRTRAGRATRVKEAPVEADGAAAGRPGETATGVVELLGNGSAFLRVSPPEASDDDVYISAAQVRRCELVSGDRVTGPVRAPRRSERYPSLVRIDTINGASADAVSDGARYEDLPVDYPSERLALGSQDPTLEAIEWLTPLGRGSRAVIVGAAHAGKTETLRRMLDALNGQQDLELTAVLSGARPEEIAQWQEGPVPPVAALSFAASADAQGQAVERAMESAKRVAARGGHAVVLIDSLDGLSPHAARKALAAARNLRDGGSLTVIATATSPLGGETAVIALDVALTSTGRQPILDLLGSGTLRPELLVGEDGARAITQARATAMEAAG